MEKGSNPKVRDDRAIELKYEPESFVEIKYFERIQVLKLHVKKMQKLLENWANEDHLKIQYALREDKEIQKLLRIKDRLIEENRKLKVQVSELLSQKVNQLKK